MSLFFEINRPIGRGQQFIRADEKLGIVDQKILFVFLGKREFQRPGVGHRFLANRLESHTQVFKNLLILKGLLGTIIAGRKEPITVRPQFFPGHEVLPRDSFLDGLALPDVFLFP